MSWRRLTDALTSLAAQTFPPSRRTDGRVVRDSARDAIDASGVRAIARESLSVAGAGLRVRLGVSAHELRLAPWRPALSALTLPLASALLCLWTFGFVPRYDHWPLGEGWALLLGGSLAAVIGAALRSRGLTAPDVRGTRPGADRDVRPAVSHAVAYGVTHPHHRARDRAARGSRALVARRPGAPGGATRHRARAREHGPPGGLGPARLRRLAAHRGPAGSRAGAHA